MSKTQIIIFAVLGVFIAIAILILAGALPGLSGKKGSQFKGVELSIWGTFPEKAVADVLKKIEEETDIKIKYSAKNPLSYEGELIDALASSKGPDIWEMPQDLILKHKDKAEMLAFEFLSQRQFKDAFVEAAEVYFTDEGIAAMPLVLDPIVLYWNRDLFGSAGIAEPAKNWDEFLNYSRKLTLTDSAGNIVQSGAALGEFANIDHFKEIISLLILQAGNPIVEPKTLEVVMDKKGESPLPPAENALNFFVEFQNPKKTSYSWNRALPVSSRAFLEGRLAMYFGFAGEYQSFVEKNPHLNFDVASVPQIKDSRLKITFAKVRGFAVSKNSKNGPAAWTALFYLSSPDGLKEISQNLFLPSVRRGNLSRKPQDPALAVFNEAALQARTWLEPDPQKTSEIFGSMIESVISGRKKTSQAVSDAARQLQALIR